MKMDIKYTVCQAYFAIAIHKLRVILRVTVS